MIRTKENYSAALYERLSREDGDKPESDSIINQQHLLRDYCNRHSEFTVVDDYIDDGFTGTNFRRPSFLRMIADIEKGKIDCVIVKDLSRFGRDYIDMGYYLERYFPEKRVRFIALNDHIDSINGAYDMMLPLKNVFNTQYARDISEKVRTAFKTKQRRGEFVGAFASYGFLKDPNNHNHLVIDPVAAPIVQRIFEMAAKGIGQVRIAKTLNDEKIPCPSEYKRLMGQKYENCRRLKQTNYWTYATIHRILRNRMYVGTMVQNRYVRETMHGKAKKADENDWILVEGTHEAIISRELWDTVQAVNRTNAKEIDFEGNLGLFAGFLRCGDCGRAMSKTTWNGRVTYSCGSYHRYGSVACTSHYIRQDDLEKILLHDINSVIATVSDLKTLAENNQELTVTRRNAEQERKRLEAALERVRRLKQTCYEDYHDELISKVEYLRYKADYDHQEECLDGQVKALENSKESNEILEKPWVEQLIKLGRLTSLDRTTIAQTVKEIQIFENRRIIITYLFSDDLRAILEKNDKSDNTTA